MASDGATIWSGTHGHDGDSAEGAFEPELEE